jgi:hypothetical protein
MTRDDIIRMARESGFEVDEEGEILESDKWHTQTIFVERFAALVAAAEREACAKVCDEQDHNGVMIAKDCAAAIRARREQ